jgi:hypothetical protein
MGFFNQWCVRSNKKCKFFETDFKKFLLLLIKRVRNDMKEEAKKKYYPSGQFLKQQKKIYQHMWRRKELD